MKKNLLIFYRILSFLFIFILSFFDNSSQAENFFLEERILEVIIFQGNTLSFFGKEKEIRKEKKEDSYFKILAIITAYSSHPSQTDDDPQITAAGTITREGIVANNFLPFGTKIKMPEIFGDKIFVVEDRMHWRKSKFHFDVWFENENDAINFGTKKSYVEVLKE